MGAVVTLTQHNERCETMTTNAEPTRTRERVAALEQDNAILRAALEMADKWESDGRPDGVMHLIARLRAALAQGRDK